MKGLLLGKLPKINMIFSDPTNRTGIIELLEDFTNTQSDSANSTSYSLARKTRDINNAYAHYVSLALKSCGIRQFQDTNQTNLPIDTLNLVSGQSLYDIKNDSLGNQILELHQLRIKDKNNQWKTLEQIDRNSFDINQYQNILGTPETYDLIENKVILYPTPDYNSTGGIEIFVSTTPTYFTTADTTKKPGIPEFHHEYLPIRASYFWYSLNMPNIALIYEKEMLRMEKDITNHFSRRNKNVNDRITTESVNSI